MPQGYAGLSNRRTRQMSVPNCGWSNAATPTQPSRWVLDTLSVLGPKATSLAEYHGCQVF